MYELNRPGRKSLAGCADACLLNWRVQDNGQPDDTDCSADIHCPMSIGVIVANGRCEAFMFNIDSGTCYLLSGDGVLSLQTSKKYWSGEVTCQNVTSVGDWAGSIVGSYIPPPPNPFSGWTSFETLSGSMQGSDTRALQSLGADISGIFPLDTRGIIYEKGGTGWGTVLYMFDGTLYIQSGAGNTVGGSVELSYTPTVQITTIQFVIDFPQGEYMLVVNGQTVDTRSGSYAPYVCGTNVGGTGNQYGGSTAVRRDTQTVLLDGSVTTAILYSRN